MRDKAYKLLAVQEGISNRAAKELIDRGVVYYRGKKVKIARADMSIDKGFFKIEKPKNYKIIFEDEFLFVVDKPPFITSEEIEKSSGHLLLHRLDQQTSGVLILCKDEDFRQKAIGEFKRKKVLKEYIAIVEGKFAEEMTIDVPIITIKGKTALSKVSKKGDRAITVVEPLEIEGKKSKVKVTIYTGRTHQIRAHLKHVGHSIIGDEKYGGKPSKRVMLHACRVEILDYKFEAKEPKEFDKFGHS